MDIILDSPLFEEPLHAEYIEAIKKEIGKLNLNLESLTAINVTSDLLTSVLKFQKEHQKQEKGMTQGTTGQAVAKVMDYVDENGNFKQEIFISDYIVKNFFNQTDSDIAQSCFHMLHHELIHIYDEYEKKTNIYTKEGRMGKNRNQLDHILTIHSDIVWSEFIAERMSSSTVTPKDITDKWEYVTQLLSHVESSFNKQKNENDDYNQIFIVLQEETSLLLKVSANFFGMMSGSIENSSELETQELFTKVLHSAYENSIMSGNWKNIYDELENLYRTYPKWNDVFQLEQLNSCIRQFWNFMGVYTEKEHFGNNFKIFIH